MRSARCACSLLASKSTAQVNCVSSRSFWASLFSPATPKRHPARDYELAACLPPIASYMQHSEALGDTVDTFEQRRQATELFLRSRQRERHMLDLPLRQSDAVIRGHYWSVLRTFDKELVSQVVQKYVALEAVISKRLEATEDPDRKQKLAEQYHKMIGHTQNFDDVTKGFCLKPDPFYLPLHVKPELNNPSTTELRLGARAAFDSMCGLLGEQNWDELGALFQDESLLERIRCGYEELSSSQQQLLQLNTDDLLFWPESDAKKCPIAGTDSAEPSRQAFLTGCELDTDGGPQSYSALLAACYNRGWLHSCLPTAVANVEDYGHAIPRFVFVSLQFGRPDAQTDWAVTDMNCVAMP